MPIQITKDNLNKFKNSIFSIYDMYGNEHRIVKYVEEMEDEFINIVAPDSYRKEPTHYGEDNLILVFKNEDIYISDGDYFDITKKEYLSEIDIYDYYLTKPTEIEIIDNKMKAKDRMIHNLLCCLEENAMTYIDDIDYCLSDYSNNINDKEIKKDIAEISETLIDEIRNRCQEVFNKTKLKYF